MKDAHNIFYCGITNVLFNALNPEILAEFSTETRTDVRHFGIAIKLYDRKKYTKSQLTKSRRRYAQPNTTKFPNLHPLVVVPSIFLISLFVATPIPLRSKLIKIPIGLFIFYICMVLYYSYIFSMTLNRGQFELDSFWHFIVRPFGVDNAELINIFALMIWAGLSIPQMINRPKLKK